MSQATIDKPPTPILQLKGSLFTLTVLQLIENNLSSLFEQLEVMVKQAPKFFQNAPIVIDLQKIKNSNDSVDFFTMAETLRGHGLIPVGVRGGNAQQHSQALSAGLALLPETRQDPEPTASTHTQPHKQPPVKQSSKVITQQVRSGQQIYANGGDLIVLAPVSPGAELLADGHIHVYGPLRGRALAGVNGNSQARIFCQSLEAELVSIAGHYWVKEDLKKSTERKSVSIYLMNEHLHIELL